MRADVLNVFLDAAANILRQETGANMQRSGLHLDTSEHITDEVTVYVALVGRVRGMLLLGMSTSAARALAAHMVGEPQPSLSELGLSALAELGNLIAGRATTLLEELGFPTDITPPTIMIGRKSKLTTLGLPRFIIPLQIEGGVLNIHVAVDVTPA